VVPKQDVNAEESLRGVCLEKSASSDSARANEIGYA